MVLWPVPPAPGRAFEGRRTKSLESHSQPEAVRVADGRNPGNAEANGSSPQWRRRCQLSARRLRRPRHNVLLFGLPGRGKTHVACAIGHEPDRRGRRVLFSPTYALVQRLLSAKRDLRLEELAALDRFDAVILDDIRCEQDRDEMEVLFTFLAERYERKSVMITSNLVFSEWDRIFKDPMTTAAAIDRLVHHATILELLGESVRAEAAAERNGTKKGNRKTTTSQPTTTNPTNGADGEI
ncbi:MAG: ATP-binding protein [Polyangiaceae bacterium]